MTTQTAAPPPSVAMTARAPATGHDSCAAKTRAGRDCRRPAGWGTDHAGVGRCKLHGGTTPSHRRAASRELARREVRRLGLERGAEPTKVGPAEAMLRALWAAHEDLSLYQELVHQLDTAPGGVDEDGRERPALYGDTFHLTGEATGEAKRHILVQLYEDAQRRCAEIAAACLRAKVAEEQIKLAQERAMFLANAMRAFATLMGHSPVLPEVRHAMREALQTALEERK